MIIVMLELGLGLSKKFFGRFRELLPCLLHSYVGKTKSRNLETGKPIEGCIVHRPPYACSAANDCGRPKQTAINMFWQQNMPEPGGEGDEKSLEL